MIHKIYGWRRCPPTQKLLIAADIVNLNIEYKEVNSCEEFKFVLPDGIELSSLAGLRYIARLRPDLGLYGGTFNEMALVDCAFEFITSEITLAVQAWVSCKENNECISKIRNELLSSLKKRIENKLLGQTYLVGERLTIADLHLACTLNYAVISDNNLLNDLPNTKRWLNLILNQIFVKKNLNNNQNEEKISKNKVENPEVKKSETEKKLENKGGKKQENNAENKEKEKKKGELTAVEIEEQIEAEAKAKSKKQNLLDTLPNSSFILDAWKREYSNTKDLKNLAMPWFWENIDKSGWSIWFMKYEKMEGENTVGYTTANMLGGFLQRLDANFRKYSFAVINVIGQTGDFDIQGVWLIRGQEIPFELKDHPSFEYFNFRKLDFQSDKNLIEDYWCNDESVEGRPIDSCKVWK